MEKSRNYILPQLPYGYKDLEPYISEEQLVLHHQKHHQSYVVSANAIFEKLAKAREEQADPDLKALLKDLSFQIGGHILHSLFWQNLAPFSESRAGQKPPGKIGETIEKEFGSFERFKKEFSLAALSVEGSGWAALVFDKRTARLLIMQIEKHNVNLYPEAMILIVLDLFEHAYYLDYKNERAKFIEAFWSILNWPEVEKRLNA